MLSRCIQEAARRSVRPATPSLCYFMTRRSSRANALFAAVSLLLVAGAPAQDATPTSRVAPAVTEARLAEILAGDDPASVAELRAMQQHVQELIARVLPATVALPGASGVLVRREDTFYVLSAAHVTVAADKQIRMRTEAGDGLRGTSLGANHESDVSLVRVDSEGEHPSVEIGESASLERGQWVLMMGHPSGRKEGRSAPARLGRVLRVPPSGYLVTDCTMQGGDSGGPLFDMRGRVVGINSRISGNLAMNMHAPIDALVGQWKELRQGKVTEERRRGRGGSRVDFGVELEFGDGCPVFGEVAADSAAFRQGLRTGDRLFEVDGDDVQSRRSVWRALRSFSVGDDVTIVVERDGKGIELTLELVRRGAR